MADAGGGRCLSDLSDDLLQHILSFAAASDRAATAVLSRRWLRLWRTSGDVYLDSRSFVAGCSSADQESSAFLHGAEEALAAAAALAPIRRLTFSISQDSQITLLKQSWSWSEQKLITEHNLLEALVSNPAARRVEELHIEVKQLNTESTLSFGSLPSEALRVLRIIRCLVVVAVAAAPPPCAATATLAFPMLVDVHLQDCCVSLVDLQSVIDAAPRLSTLHLASTCFSRETNYSEEEEEVVVVRHLLMPTVRALVLADCIHQYKGSLLELDVPSLQYFRYMGHVDDTNRLSLKSQASTIHVDLHFGLTRGYNGAPTRELFWRFLQNFNSTKLLKLRMDYFTMDCFALEDEAIRDELLGLGGLSLSLVEKLELEAEYNIETSMVMLADLLHCCPMLRDLHIKLTKKQPWRWSDSSTIDKEAAVHFDKSVSAFRNRRRRSRVSLAAQNDGNYEAYLDIPGLTGQNPFSCLQSHLKKVSLQFFRDEPNCLGVQLAKFFAQNAMVLQGLHIDDGCQEMLVHANFCVRRWIANIDNANNQLTVKD